MTVTSPRFALPTTDMIVHPLVALGMIASFIPWMPLIFLVDMTRTKHDSKTGHIMNIDNDRALEIKHMLLARPTFNHALYDLATRSAYLRGFEDMRAQALHAVHVPKSGQERKEALE